MYQTKVQGRDTRPEEMGPLLWDSINSVGYEILTLNKFKMKSYSGLIQDDNQGEKATILTKSLWEKDG